MSAASTSAVLRHVPSELLEEILFKLPVKSLVRFSTVSKSWLSMISEPRFVQEQKRRAAVNGVGRTMITLPFYDRLDSDIYVCRIPHTSSTVIDDSTRLICSIEGDLRRLHASCDGLCLVEAEDNVETEKSLYLWNPSTRTHRKLPNSPLPATGHKFVCGLGYDSSADDYKVLKIAREQSSTIPTELYSLKSDSWKTISPPPTTGIHWQERCEYLNGTFHWIPISGNTIVSFDLSTEKCGEITFPGVAVGSDQYVEVVVTRGKLCLNVNSEMFSDDYFCFALWVMEEYGVEKSWTKVVNIGYRCTLAYFYPYGILRLVYLYDNGDVLFQASGNGLYKYTNEGGRFDKIVAGDWRAVHGGFIYFESLVSPLRTQVINSNN